MIVLLVENEVSWCNVIEEILHQAYEKLEILTTSKLVEAEFLLQRNRIDLAIINLNLFSDNDYFGEKLLSKIQQQYPSLPRIVVTGTTLPDEFCTNYELEAYVAKHNSQKKTYDHLYEVLSQVKIKQQYIIPYNPEKKLQILIVEQDMRWRRAFMAILKTTDNETAEDFIEALTLLEKIKFDMVIISLDLLFDDTSNQLLEIIRYKNTTMPFLYITNTPNYHKNITSFRTDLILTKGDFIKQDIYYLTNQLLRRLNMGIHQKIKDVLLRCEQFDTDRNIQAIFVDQRLYSWQNSLPQESTRDKRVQAFINFFNDQYTVNQENGLVLLLQVLSEHIDRGDMRHHELIQLANELEQVKKEQSSKSNNIVEDKMMSEIEMGLAVSVIEKTTDFLFGHAGEMLKEWREKHKNNLTPPEVNQHGIRNSEVLNNVLKTKLSQLSEKSQISAMTFRIRELESLQKQMEDFRKQRLFIEEEAAKPHGFDDKIIIRQRFEEIDTKIVEKMRKMREILEYVCQTKIIVPALDE